MVTVLIDDERNFLPGFRDDAIIFRSVHEAVDGFRELNSIDELWLDFNLKYCESVFDLLTELKNEKISLENVKKVFLHSSSASGDSLLILGLGLVGVPESRVERIWDFQNVFQPLTQR